MIIMRTSRYLTAAALFIGVLALVNAQPGGGQFGGGGGGPLLLLFNKNVQEELKMTDDQVAKATEFAKEEGKKLGEMSKEKLAGIDRKSDEGRAKFAEINAELAKMTYTDLEKAAVLKPEQLKRLRQLERQSLGVRAFTNSEVVATLKITDDQKSTIKGISDEYNKDSQAIRTEFGLGFGGGKGGKTDPAKSAEGNKKLDKLRESTMAKITESLTADQKTAWKDLVGEPYDVSKLRFTPMIPKKDPEE